DVSCRAAQGLQFDLIICRNVTLYFTPEAARRLYAGLIESLGPAGWLVCGPSDPAPDAVHQIEPLFLAGAVLWRRGDVNGSIAQSAPRPVSPEQEEPTQPATARQLGRPLPAARRVGRYAPTPKKSRP